MPYFRHQITKATERAPKAPGPEWDRIDGPEKVDPAGQMPPGVQDVPTPTPPSADAAKADWVAFGAALGDSEVELSAMSKADLVAHLTP